ncbi:MAG: hypothetical protein DWP95_08255, partial [Proteobacteria bacterium]
MLAIFIQVGAMTLTTLFRLLPLLLLLLLTASNAPANQSVSLQLRWSPSFQFAGFYAAQSQKYYQQQGIQVSVKSGFNEYEELVSPIEEVMTGRADFGVDDLQLLDTIDDGGQLVILAPIMQKSATALVTTATNPITKIHDLMGKTIKVPKDNHLIKELKVLLNAHQISLDEVHFIFGPISVTDLHSPNIDVLLTYGANVEFNARLHNLQVSVIHLSDLGSSFFGNVLFTHQSVINEQPELVNRFLQASLAGWQYALTHELQIIEQLSQLNNHLVPRNDRVKYNQAYAASMQQYMQWPQVTVGHSPRSRWHQIFNDLYNSNLMKGGWNIDDYLYSPHISIRQWGLYFIMLVTGVVVLFIVVRFNSLQEYRHVFVIGLVIILLLYALIEYNICQRHEQTLRFKTLQSAQDLNTSLGNYINNDVILVKNLAAYIAVNPSLDKAEFLAFCAEIFEQGEALINLAAAPNLIIKMIYPITGNEAALGMDYRRVPSQKALVFQALNERKTVFSNPMQLIQGGRGVFIRQAVYTSQSDEPWGVVTATVDINDLFAKAGIFSKADQFNMVLETKDLNDQTYTIYGNPYYIKHSSALTVPMNITDNQWQLYISPVEGWSLGTMQLWLLRLIGVLFIAVWFFRVRFLLKRK